MRRVDSGYHDFILESEVDPALRALGLDSGMLGNEHTPMKDFFAGMNDRLARDARFDADRAARLTKFRSVALELKTRERAGQEDSVSIECDALYSYRERWESGVWVVIVFWRERERILRCADIGSVLRNLEQFGAKDYETARSWERAFGFRGPPPQIKANPAGSGKPWVWVRRSFISSAVPLESYLPSLAKEWMERERRLKSEQPRPRQMELL